MMDENDLFHHFQPIYHLEKGVIIGFEGLLRAKEYSPEEVFDEAIKKREALRIRYVVYS